MDKSNALALSCVVGARREPHLRVGLGSTHVLSWLGSWPLGGHWERAVDGQRPLVGPVRRARKKAWESGVRGRKEEGNNAFTRW